MKTKALDDCRKETWCGVGCRVAVMGLPRQGRKHRFSSVAAAVAQMKS